MSVIMVRREIRNVVVCVRIRRRRRDIIMIGCLRLYVSFTRFFTRLRFVAIRRVWTGFLVICAFLFSHVSVIPPFFDRGDELFPLLKRIPQIL